MQNSLKTSTAFSSGVHKPPSLHPPGRISYARTSWPFCPQGAGRMHRSNQVISRRTSSAPKLGCWPGSYILCTPPPNAPLQLEPTHSCKKWPAAVVRARIHLDCRAYPRKPPKTIAGGLLRAMTYSFPPFSLCLEELSRQLQPQQQFKCWHLTFQLSCKPR